MIVPSSELECARLIGRFESATLPKPEWTHGAHVAVAVWYVSRYGEAAAIDRVRSGILALNAAP